VNILGLLHWEGAHDTSAAIVRDGRLVVAAEEERFTRRKHDGRFPISAIGACLAHAGLRMKDIDAIAFPTRPYRSGSDSIMAEITPGALRRMVESGERRRRALAHKWLLDRALAAGLRFNWQMDPTIEAGFRVLREHYPDIPAIHYFSHHLSHAAAAYFTSPYGHAAVATIDGRGDPFATVTWHARGQDIERLAVEPAGNSLGLFYRDCTRHVGLGSFAEGKTMGLAAYGDPAAFAARMPAMLAAPRDGWYRYAQRPALETAGFPPRGREPIVAPPYADFAAAAQQALEQAVDRVVASALDQSGESSVCLGGGVSLNCASNGKLLARMGPSSVWVFPACGDAGLSVGAAFLCARDHGELVPEPIDHAYWGPDITRAEILAAVARHPEVEARELADIPGTVGAYLAAGQVIGWMQGRMELGPRALGHRSILADPGSVQMRDRVNRLKGREPWRPLGPVVVRERAAEYFDLSGPSPFMLFAAQVRPQARARIAGVVHADGSARPQTITHAQNALLYDLLLEFERRAGVPILINTSFNTAAEPIVCTPDDAIRTLLASGLDALIVGPFEVRRRGGAA
jgi:carbamoyltransferase